MDEYCSTVSKVYSVHFRFYNVGFYKEFYDEMLDYTPKIKWPIEDKELFGINLYIIAFCFKLESHIFIDAI